MLGIVRNRSCCPSSIHLVGIRLVLDAEWGGCRGRAANRWGRQVQEEYDDLLEKVHAQVRRIRCALEENDFAPDDRAALTRVLAVLEEVRGEILQAAN